mmetsp:Transcript_22987/g.50115  ORF Transcript_22987/g.50115 Transcript_22987/m.50115 type:complete len:233 (-) Transcript_22987:98-796(-)
MRSNHQIHVVLLEEFLDDVFAKKKGASTVVDVPTDKAGLRIGPQQIAEQALFADVHGSLDGVDLFDFRQFRGEATVHAKYLVGNDRGAGHAVEGFAKSLPQPDGIPALAFVVKAVHATQLCRFVVAPQQVHFVGVFDLVRKKKTQDLDRLLSPIAVVAQKHVVRVRRLAAEVDDPQGVVELTVQITADLDGCLRSQDHGFAQKYFSHAGQQVRDFFLFKVHSGTRTSGLQVE